MTCGLRKLGYTAREASFLELAGLQSGYFLRKQFNLYIGRECGALAQSLIQRAVRLGHVKVREEFGNRHLHHLCARPFYELVGEPENRNRRQHSSDTIRHRLMMLDYLLARPAENWLLTSTHRSRALAERGLRSSAVTSSSPTPIDLPDRQPVSVDPQGGLRLAFIDDGLLGFSKWERFIERCLPLLRTDSSAVIVYASCIPDRFRAAEKLFRGMAGEDTATGAINRNRLRQYFAARQLFDNRAYGHFDKSSIDRLRDDQRAFAGAVFEALYRQWQIQGDSALESCAAPDIHFETFTLGPDYSWLSPIRFQERRVSYGPDSRTGKKGS